MTNEENITTKEYLDDDGKPVIEVSSPKRKEPVVVYKSVGGFPFFSLKLGGGQKNPKELNGQYTQLSLAKAAAIVFLKNSKVSQTARRDNNTAAREARKNPTPEAAVKG